MLQKGVGCNTTVRTSGDTSFDVDKSCVNSSASRYQLCQKLCQPPLPQLGALCQPLPQPPFPQLGALCQPPLPQPPLWKPPLPQLCQPPLPQPPFRQPNPPLSHAAMRTSGSPSRFFWARAFISETPLRISRRRSATADMRSGELFRSCGSGSECTDASAEEMPSTPAGRSIASAFLVLRRIFILSLP